MYTLSWYKNSGAGVISVCCSPSALPPLVGVFEKAGIYYKISDRCGYVAGELMGLGELYHQLDEKASF
jgi:hypothetical protein